MTCYRWPKFHPPGMPTFSTLSCSRPPVGGTRSLCILGVRGGQEHRASLGKGKVKVKGTASLPGHRPSPQDPGGQHPAGSLPPWAAVIKGPLFPDGRGQRPLLVFSAPWNQVTLAPFNLSHNQSLRLVLCGVGGDRFSDVIFMLW